MRSTTQARLDMNSAYNLTNIHAIISACRRVTDFRIRLMVCLIRKYNWPADQAHTFVSQNGNVWR